MGFRATSRTWDFFPGCAYLGQCSHQAAQLRSIFCPLPKCIYTEVYQVSKFSMILFLPYIGGAGLELNSGPLAPQATALTSRPWLFLTTILWIRMFDESDKKSQKCHRRLIRYWGNESLTNCQDLKKSFFNSPWEVDLAQSNVWNKLRPMLKGLGHN